MLTRKQFLRSVVATCAGTLGLVVLGCGTEPPRSHPDAATPSPDGGRLTDAAGPGGATPDTTGAAGDAATPGRCAADGTTSVIADNHGHVLVVTKADVAAGVDKSYDIQGTSDHAHTVAITAAMFAQLQQDHAISTTSSFDAGHDHGIMVACA